MTDNKFVRTASGVWKLDDAPNAAPSRTTPVPSRTTPVPSRTTPVPSRTTPTPALPRNGATPSRGLPQAPKDRAQALAELARTDLAKGNLVSAETNFRLALTFSPGDQSLQVELRGVVEMRDRARKASGPQIR